jgi:hypothetical protein
MLAGNDKKPQPVTVSAPKRLLQSQVTNGTNTFDEHHSQEQQELCGGIVMSPKRLEFECFGEERDKSMEDNLLCQGQATDPSISSDDSDDECNAEKQNAAAAAILNDKEILQQRTKSPMEPVKLEGNSHLTPVSHPNEASDCHSIEVSERENSNNEVPAELHRTGACLTSSDETPDQGNGVSWGSTSDAPCQGQVMDPSFSARGISKPPVRAANLPEDSTGDTHENELARDCRSHEVTKRKDSEREVPAGSRCTEAYLTGLVGPLPKGNNLAGGSTSTQSKGFQNMKNDTLLGNQAGADPSGTEQATRRDVVLPQARTSPKEVVCDDAGVSGIASHVGEQKEAANSPYYEFVSAGSDTSMILLSGSGNSLKEEEDDEEDCAGDAGLTGTAQHKGQKNEPFPTPNPVEVSGETDKIAICLSGLGSSPREEEDHLRRSKRASVQPLGFYKNERIIRGPNSNVPGEPDKIAIRPSGLGDSPREEEDSLRRSKRASVQPLGFYKKERINHGPNSDVRVPEALANLPGTKSIVVGARSSYKSSTRTHGPGTFENDEAPQHRALVNRPQNKEEPSCDYSYVSTLPPDSDCSDSNLGSDGGPPGFARGIYSSTHQRFAAKHVNAKVAVDRTNKSGFEKETEDCYSFGTNEQLPDSSSVSSDREVTGRNAMPEGRSGRKRRRDDNDGVANCADSTDDSYLDTKLPAAFSQPVTRRVVEESILPDVAPSSALASAALNLEAPVWRFDGTESATLRPAKKRKSSIPKTIGVTMPFVQPAVGSVGNNVLAQTNRPNRSRRSSANSSRSKPGNKSIRSTGTGTSTSMGSQAAVTFKKQYRPEKVVSKTSKNSPLDWTRTTSSKSGNTRNNLVDLSSSPPWTHRPAMSAPANADARPQRVYGSRGNQKRNTDLVDLVGHDDLGELLKQVE